METFPVPVTFFADKRLQRLAVLLNQPVRVVEARVLRLWAFCYENETDRLDGLDLLAAMDMGMRTLPETFPETENPLELVAKTIAFVGNSLFHSGFGKPCEDNKLQIVDVSEPLQAAAEKSARGRRLSQTRRGDKGVLSSNIYNKQDSLFRNTEQRQEILPGRDCEGKPANKPRGVIEPLKVAAVDTLLASVRCELQQAWIETYDDVGWLVDQLKQARVWIAANPKRAPKSDLGRFLNSWLSRGWERHRKTIASNRPGGQVEVIG